MRAAVFHGPLDVRIEDVAPPGGPGDGDVLLEVIRAAICGTDATEYAHGPKMVPLHHRHHATGHKGPVVLGHEFVGIVREGGDRVDGFSVGDRVVPGSGGWCGHCVWCREGRTNLCRNRFLVGIHRDGGIAESVLVPAAMCRPVPAGLSDDAASMAQPLAVALHGIGRARVGESPLVVIGAGGIGALVIAAAKHQGSRLVIALDVSPGRRERALMLGADHAFDAADPDIKARLYELLDGDGPEVVAECSGAPSTPAFAADLTRPGGRLLLMGMQSAPTELDLFTLTQWEVDILPANAHVCHRDLAPALEMLASSDLAERIIGSRIPLERLVPDGLEPLANGTAEGKIVIDPWN